MRVSIFQLIMSVSDPPMCARCETKIRDDRPGRVCVFRLELKLEYCSSACLREADDRISTREKRAKVIRSMRVQERVKANQLMTLILSMGGGYGNLVSMISPYLTFNQRQHWREACGNYFAAPSPTLVQMHRLFRLERARTRELKVRVRSLNTRVSGLINRVRELHEEKGPLWNEVDAAIDDARKMLKIEVEDVINNLGNPGETQGQEEAVDGFRDELIRSINLLA